MFGGEVGMFGGEASLGVQTYRSYTADSQWPKILIVASLRQALAAVVAAPTQKL